jgi:hypothetical protein
MSTTSYNTSGTISDVLIGTGVLYAANKGTAFPGADSTTATEWAEIASGWSDVGYSEDGWTLEYDKSFEDIMVAEEIDPIKSVKTAQEIRITGTLAQASLTNLNLAFGGGTLDEDDTAYGDGYDTLVPPATTGFNEKSLLLVTEGASGAIRHFQIPRAVNVGAFSMAHQKAPQKVLIAVEFKILVPDSSSTSVGTTDGKENLFRIVENTNGSTEGVVN